jgi:hypothetical protein
MHFVILRCERIEPWSIVNEKTVKTVRNIVIDVAELVATEDLSNIHPTNPLANKRLFCAIDLV